jgi:hypothetical protein
VFEPVTRLGLLGISPPLPIIIRNIYHPRMSDYNFDSMLIHRDRIYAIHICYSNLPNWNDWSQRCMSNFQRGHLMFDYLPIHSFSAVNLLVRFLGGSVPRPQTLELRCIIFPVPAKLLLSATDIVRLTPRSIPQAVRSSGGDGHVLGRVDQSRVAS